MLAEIFRQAELPAGVVNMVFGNGPVTGSALVKSSRIAGVSFTGGTATGIQIRRDTAADIHKHLSLELGGKNPTLIFDDVDLEKAVSLAARAAFENQGEVCSKNAPPFPHPADKRADMPLWFQNLCTETNLPFIH